MLKLYQIMIIYLLNKTLTELNTNTENFRYWTFYFTTGIWIIWWLLEAVRSEWVLLRCRVRPDTEYKVSPHSLQGKVAVCTRALWDSRLATDWKARWQTYGEERWGEVRAERGLPRTAGLRTLGCCCCCSRGGRWSRWTEGLNGWSPAPHLQGNVNCPDCPLFCQAERHRDSPGQHQCLRYPPPRKSSCYWSCCYCC